MGNVYIVIGATGEYSDHLEWPVKAYTDEDAAQDHVEKASRRANELYAEREMHQRRIEVWINSWKETHPTRRFTIDWQDDMPPDIKESMDRRGQLDSYDNNKENEYDPDMQLGYSGVNYYLWTVELAD